MFFAVDDFRFDGFDASDSVGRVDGKIPNLELFLG
jgi:hypothetical protein